MENESKQVSIRKKIIFLGLGTIAFLTIFKFFRSSKKGKTVKMLSQDGRLVEVNEELLSPNRKKITNGELQNWVKPGK